MTPRDRWNRMFDAIDDEGRGVVLDMLAGEYERVQASRRARLRLVDCSHTVANIPHQPVNPVSISGAG